MRTLVVDAMRLVGPRTGQGRHVEFLAREWSTSDCPFDRIVLATPEPIDLGIESKRVVTKAFAGWLPRAAWEQLALPRFASTASLLFAPTYIGPVAYRGRTVVANHGFYERLPGEFTRLERLRAIPLYRLAARRATRVIANSENTRRDIAEFFDVPPQRIDVVYPAADEVFFSTHRRESIEQEVVRALGAPVPYLIFVGKLARRRHLPSLIAALGQLRERGHPHRLLIVGPNTADVDIAREARANAVEHSVVHIRHLDQMALSRLYAGADAFVLPTTYEGISQTMFEAMASGAPCVTVEHPTVHEGAKGTVVVVPTPAVADLVAGIESVLKDPRLRTSLVERARSRARQFSWTATARRTMEILDDVAFESDRA